MQAPCKDFRKTDITDLKLRTDAIGTSYCYNMARLLLEDEVPHYFSANSSNCKSSMCSVKKSPK